MGNGADKTGAMGATGNAPVERLPQFPLDSLHSADMPAHAPERPGVPSEPIFADGYEATAQLPGNEHQSFREPNACYFEPAASVSVDPAALVQERLVVLAHEMGLEPREVEKALSSLDEAGMQELERRMREFTPEAVQRYRRSERFQAAREKYRAFMESPYGGQLRAGAGSLAATGLALYAGEETADLFTAGVNASPYYVGRMADGLGMDVRRAEAAARFVADVINLDARENPQLRFAFVGLFMIAFLKGKDAAFRIVPEALAEGRAMGASSMRIARMVTSQLGRACAGQLRPLQAWRTAGEVVSGPLHMGAGVITQTAVSVILDVVWPESKGEPWRGQAGLASFFLPDIYKAVATPRMLAPFETRIAQGTARVAGRLFATEMLSQGMLGLIGLFAGRETREALYILPRLVEKAEVDDFRQTMTGGTLSRMSAWTYAIGFQTVKFLLPTPTRLARAGDLAFHDWLSDSHRVEGWINEIVQEEEAASREIHAALPEMMSQVLTHGVGEEYLDEAFYTQVDLSSLTGKIEVPEYAELFCERRDELVRSDAFQQLPAAEQEQRLTDLLKQTVDAEHRHAALLLSKGRALQGSMQYVRSLLLAHSNDRIREMVDQDGGLLREQEDAFLKEIYPNQTMEEIRSTILFQRRVALVNRIRGLEARIKVLETEMQGQPGNDPGRHQLLQEERGSLEAELGQLRIIAVRLRSQHREGATPITRRGS